MAIIEYSPTMMATVVGRLFNPFQQAAVSTNNNACLPFFPYAAAITPGVLNGVYIMQGTMPADFSTLTSYSSRSADILVAFPSNTSFTGSSYANSKFTLTTPYVTAAASGTATWFWAIGLAGPSTSTSATIWQQFMGTVGVIGSGADLTITDTNIISGNTYRVTSLIIDVPSTYTV